MSETKTCAACKQDLPLTEFYFRKDDGKYRSSCKKCKRVKTKVEICAEAKSETKICKHCGIEKNRDEYQKAGGGKWLQPYCKPCDKIRKDKHRQDNIDHIKEKAHKNYLKNRKLVPPEIKAKNEAIRTQNLRESAKKYLASLTLLTPEEKKARKSENDKRYREKNKAVLTKKKKEYATSEIGRKKACEWQAKNMDNIEYRLKKNLRGRVYVALKRGIKSQTTMKLLGCTIEQFKDHFQSLFTEGMTWDKYLNGEIHIDHIIPCKHFRLEDPEEQKKCFHFSNLQPLWELDNLRKGTSLNYKIAS